MEGTDTQRSTFLVVEIERLHVRLVDTVDKIGRQVQLVIAQMVRKQNQASS